MSDPTFKRIALRLHTALLVLIVAGVSACAPTHPSLERKHAFTAPEILDAETARQHRQSRSSYGIVRRSRVVLLTQPQTSVGLVAGAAVGGLLGNKVGKGKGRKVTMLLGNPA